jgi:hypothetical protein
MPTTLTPRKVGLDRLVGQTSNIAMPTVWDRVSRITTVHLLDPEFYSFETGL